MLDQPVSGSAKNEIQFLSDILYFIFDLQLIKNSNNVENNGGDVSLFATTLRCWKRILVILYLIEHFVPEQPVRVFLVSQNSKLGFNFSYHFIQGLSHRLVRGPLGASWFEIFGVPLVLVRCDP